MAARKRPIVEALLSEILAAAEAAPAEPEVIKKGKKEEEGAAEAKPEAKGEAKPKKK